MLQPQVASAQAINQVNKIAKQITVLVDSPNGNRGIARFSSGDKQGGLADLKYSDYLFKQLKQKYRSENK